jgi:hypothetical protein
LPAAQAAPVVQNLQVADGSAQRSSVNSVTLTFSEVVALGSGAISVQRIGPGGSLGSVSFTIDTSMSTSTQTIARLIFNGSMTQYGSLIDGDYQISINHNLVLDTGGRAMASDYSATFFRFFGDSNGDATVNGLDFGLFRSAFGTALGDSNYVAYFDFNGDGVINGLDFGQFNLRFGTTLP